MYFHFVKKVIKKQKYEKLIVLTTLTGMFLYHLLTRKYNQEFILDYRDASYEFLNLYKFILGKLVDNSTFTCISSSRSYSS